MNFLAHIYLSGSDNELLMGNFIGDSVKGKKAILQFPDQVQKGIIVHRDIDFFMDHHPIVKKGMNRLRAGYPKFSGVIIDMFYDHFLAKNWGLYSGVKLDEYIQNVYRIIEENNHLLIGRSKNMFPKMRKANWLLSYQTIEGMADILEQMTHRIKYLVPMNESINEMKEFYDEYDEEFKLYFAEVMSFLKEKHGINF